jgi:geranylgeranyl diphosphate synthase type I
MWRYRYHVNLEPQFALADIRIRVQRDLTDFLAEQTHYLGEIGIELIPAAEAINAFLLDGGKRLRPLFAYCGYICAGGKDDETIIRAIASLELLQGCALIHDDLMDASDTRRGKPSIHRLFESIHKNEELSGSSANYGASTAILLGDLALVWADQMLHQSGISGSQLIRTLPIYDEMRVEIMAGQFLDIHEQALATQSVARSLKIARYKSGKYTVERPLHFGTSLALEAGKKRENFFAMFSEFGLPLGEAFQLRDDLLGVFGDPILTGKPAGDDLREGKRTVLMAMTQDRASAKQDTTIAQLFGDRGLDPDGVNALREIIAETGARDHVEGLIDKLTLTALDALNRDEIAPNAHALLNELVTIAIGNNG